MSHWRPPRRSERTTVRGEHHAGGCIGCHPFGRLARLPPHGPSRGSVHVIRRGSWAAKSAKRPIAFEVGLPRRTPRLLRILRAGHTLSAPAATDIKSPGWSCDEGSICILPSAGRPVAGTGRRTRDDVRHLSTVLPGAASTSATGRPYILTPLRRRMRAEPPCGDIA